MVMTDMTDLQKRSLLMSTAYLWLLAVNEATSWGEVVLRTGPRRSHLRR